MDIKSRIDRIKQFNLFDIHDRTGLDRAPKSPDVQFTNESNESSVEAQQTSSDVADSESVPQIPAVKMIQLKEEEAELTQQEKECGKDMYHFQGYFEKLEQSRNEKCSHMKRLYNSIGPVLVKLESLVLGTFTGRSEKMRGYYTYWEQMTYQCILEWVNSKVNEDIIL